MHDSHQYHLIVVGRGDEVSDSAHLEGGNIIPVFLIIIVGPLVDPYG